MVLLTEEPDRYVERDDWLVGLRGTRLIRTRRWGVATERRFALASGLEIELGVVSPAWASVNPVDDGTRRVTTDGMRVLYDPDRLLAERQQACQDAAEHGRTS